MLWIKVYAKLGTSATIQRIADACKVRRAEAQGLVVGVLCALPAHARDGNLSQVPDRSLEQWADWQGKANVFARAFRAEMTTDGVVTQWDKMNGSAIKRSDTEQERLKVRNEREQEAMNEADYSLGEPESPQLPRNFPALSLRPNLGEIEIDIEQRSKALAVQSRIATSLLAILPPTPPSRGRSIGLTRFGLLLSMGAK